MAIRIKTWALQYVALVVGSFIVVRIAITSMSNEALVSSDATQRHLTAYDATSEQTAEYSSLKTGRVPSTDFQPGYPKKVVILTYQRCGSSFFGQLFNTNPDVFYMYEPLDSVYTALYGTKEGWNVPSDITSYWDGTERRLPEKEKKAVAVFLKHLLACQIQALPTELLIHKYWFQFAGDHTALGEYIHCLRVNNIHQTNCSQAGNTQKHCGLRFGDFPQDRMDECNQRLWNASFVDESLDTATSTAFTRYKTCMTGMRELTTDKCTPLFQAVCDRSRLRSAKTVRGTMASMEHLLAREKNFRVIHLMRDPRAVVLSRRQFDNSGRGKYSMGDMVKEASLYCRTVVNDVYERRRLEKLYPGRIINIIYEDLVTEPLRYTEKIYQFLNTTLPEKTKKWVMDHTSKVKDSSKIAQKWMDELSFRKTNDITQQCMKFFSEIDYPWVGVPG